MKPFQTSAGKTKPLTVGLSRLGDDGNWYPDPIATATVSLIDLDSDQVVLTSPASVLRTEQDARTGQGQTVLRCGWDTGAPREGEYEVRVDTVNPRGATDRAPTQGMLFAVVGP